ncbi:Lysine exporter protein (LYSE/YGGA) [Rhodomicrobium vannielii ATCC 17100]|uniref:Lysine exporter protein (LYSE/YGGA) n=1 Tax=Rhodomicrobium vannielii (strain ATCC 17100 / DSM 162 / LMG 4299 / NCIMB 10020 / ATH 3.1.1) TaxID=648757 RepID=E3I5R3_RHOVT|nr:LysE family translocator [Rhodomicrobium vannielii]ADP69416.1 Lysine exporter protein (LYSE/YGGA) [Rhodomicrobium vannielii ATCC 17100]MBJ7535014.1 LysE family translocator [Rhodomicrobium vannielii ATCC 17100]
MSTSFAVFLPACFALNMAFGPNNLLSLTIGARHGVMPAIAAAPGRLVAFAVMIAITAAGMGALLMASEAAFTAVKLLGAAYLVWIGVRLIIAKGFDTLAAPKDSTQAPGSFLRQEFLVAASNPKAMLIFTAFLPQFVDQSDYWRSFLLVGVVFLILEVPAIAIYALIGSRIGRLAQGGSASRWINRVSGSMMVAFGVALAFARRPAS